jgi:hypothetical protein
MNNDTCEYATAGSFFGGGAVDISEAVRRKLRIREDLWMFGKR